MAKKKKSDNTAAGELSGTDEESKYGIDFRAMQVSGKSSSFIVRSRLCGCCDVCLSAEDDSMELKSASEYMKQISQSCRQRDEYLLPGASLTEAIFRLLLGNQNRPMKLREIQSGLVAAWTSAVYLKNLTDEVVVKLMETPNEYFIRRVD